MFDDSDAALKPGLQKGFPEKAENTCTFQDHGTPSVFLI